MAEIIRFYTQKLPAMKFVGRGYGEADSVGGLFSCKWGEWFEKDLFTPLCLQDDGGEPFDDCNAYIGLGRCKEGEPFRYYIGVFLPLDVAVPEGYEALEFDAGEIGVCWIQGKEPDIYQLCSLSRLKDEGYEWTEDKNGVKWFMERYACPRFTEPDDKGNVILDICYYVKKL